MTYESRRKIGVLPWDLHRLGKALARGSGYKSIADAVIDSAVLRKAVEDRLCSDVNIECKRLCSKANPTLLRTATKDSVLNFSWRAIGQEIREKSPLFYRLLLASADPKSLSKSSDPETTERYPGIGTAAAVLLTNRNKGMSFVPYVISTILKVGRTSKRVSTKLFVFLVV